MLAAMPCCCSLCCSPVPCGCAGSIVRIESVPFSQRMPCLLCSSSPSSWCICLQLFDALLPAERAGRGVRTAGRRVGNSSIHTHFCTLPCGRCPLPPPRRSPHTFLKLTLSPCSRCRAMCFASAFATPPCSRSAPHTLNCTFARSIVEIVAVFFGIFLVGRVPRRFLAEMQTSVTSPSGPGAQQAWSPVCLCLLALCACTVWEFCAICVPSCASCVVVPCSSASDRFLTSLLYVCAGDEPNGCSRARQERQIRPCRRRRRRRRRRRSTRLATRQRAH